MRTFTIADVRDVARDDYDVADEDVRHFKAGANVSWSPRFIGDLDRAEDAYERKQGLDPFSDAARAFSYGYCWGATQ